MRSLWSSILLLSAFLDVSQRSLAVHVELPRRSPTDPLPNVFARAPDNSTSILDYFSGGYFINITLNGAPFSVMIDTGRCVD
jgi:predicted aspartyl protease